MELIFGDSREKFRIFKNRPIAPTIWAVGGVLYISVSERESQRASARDRNSSCVRDVKGEKEKVRNKQTDGQTDRSEAQENFKCVFLC